MKKQTLKTLASLLPLSTIQSSVIKTLSHKFYDRDDALSTLLKVARSNYFSRQSSDSKDHRFILIPGGIGIGKTRTGWESQHLSSNLKDEIDSSFKEALKNPLYISVDLKNGYKFLRGFDEHASSTVQIGARVALASGLMSGSLYDLWKSGNINRFELYEVVREILKRRPEKVGAIIIHLVEYQLYINAIQQYITKDWEHARSIFKEMLQDIGGIMLGNLKIIDEIRKEKNEEVDFFIIPICTGTSAIDIHFLPTEYENIVLELKPLNYVSAKSMFLDKYDYSKQTTIRGRDLVTQGLTLRHSSDLVVQKDINKLSKGFCDFVLNQQHFHIAMYDTGFIPKFIDDLLSPPILMSDFDWGNQLFTAMSRRSNVKINAGPGSWNSLDDVRSIISFGLTRQPVKRDFRLNSRISIGELERAGLIYLSKYEYDWYTIVMPFMLLKVLNNSLLVSKLGTVFPDHLLLIPTHDSPWQWQDFELLYGYYQKALIDSLFNVKKSKLLSIEHKIDLLQSNLQKEVDDNRKLQIKDEIKTQNTNFTDEINMNWQLSDIFRGAKGANKLLQHKVRLHTIEDDNKEIRKLKDYNVYTENEKFLVKTDDIAKFTKYVSCDDNVTREFDEGIFRCYKGCANIDHRWVLDSADEGKKLTIFSQIKYSERNATTISTPAIKRWYDKTMASVKNYNKDEYDVILVLFTNRTCMGPIDIEKMPQLLLIYPENIENYLSPTFAHRGLVSGPSENEMKEN